VWANYPTSIREAAKCRKHGRRCRAVGELASAGVELIKIIISDNAIFGRPDRAEIAVGTHRSHRPRGTREWIAVAAHTETQFQKTHADRNSG